MIYLIVIIAVIAIDRAVKAAVLSGFDPGDSVPVIGEFFRITYVQNRGVAFSMLDGHGNVIIAVTALLLCAAFVFLLVFRRKNPPLFNTGLALVCGGGLGNIIDRMMYGYVVDMLDFGRFPVFNAADVCICVGCGLMLLYALRAIQDDKEA